MSSLQSLVLPALGIQFAYLDSGPPNVSSYTTIFIVHGMIFTAPVFQKVLALASSSSMRIVAINRRDYPGSSELAPEGIALMTGEDEAQHRFLSDRGLEILTFVDQFSREYNLPAISDDGKTGGVALLGWSLGNSFTLAAVANASKLDSETKNRLSKRLRALIIEDAPSVSLGMSMLEGTWNPATEHAIPMQQRFLFTLLWLTAYFDHGDLSTRDPKKLTYALPSATRPPSVYSMASKREEIVCTSPLNGSEGLLISHLSVPLHANYEKAVFGEEVRALFPVLTVSAIARAASYTNGIATLWEMQDNDEQRGGGHLRFELALDTNHFVHWDHPEVAIESWKRALT